jgi:hypothetical protein
LLSNQNSLKKVIDSYVENAKGTIFKLKRNVNNIMPRFTVMKKKQLNFAIY